MKMDGLTHPKTKELSLKLGVPLPHAIGLLELMWHFVGQQTPRGDIGKWSNGVIADAAGWAGDADEFVDALVSVRFLDLSDEHRLLVHHWEHHAPRWVFAKLKATGQKIIKSDLSQPLSGGHKRSQAKPSQALSPKGDSSASPPDCPHEEIIALYHEQLPSLRVVREWSDTRKAMLRKRWREKPERQSLDWWRDFFAYVAKSDFLCGRVTGRDGRVFEADLEWLVSPKNFAKVIEGKYE